jgi:4,5-DOPA dioxygenase extradiol
MVLKLKNTFYISHGSPAFALNEPIPGWMFLNSWEKEVFLEKPSSILIISGHWDTDVPTVTAVDQNDTVYDFAGLPEDMLKDFYKVICSHPIVFEKNKINQLYSKLFRSQNVPK